MMIDKLDLLKMFNERQTDAQWNKAVEKTVNQLVDAVNGILDYAPLEMAMKAEPKPADPYAEERKWIGCVCKFLCSDPKLNEIKIRLYDKDRQYTKEYTLSKLIYTKFKRNKFEYRGMSTGLKDKNGNLIYEGDIVKCDRDFAPDGRVNLTKEVIFTDGTFTLANLDPKNRDFCYINRFHNIEIIGNIHEQPEQKD